MSCARFSDDGKEVYIECNYGRKLATVVLKHMDKNPEIENDCDRILFKFYTADHADINSQMMVTNQIILRKSNTVVLSHVFRTVADVMDKWYNDE